MSHVTKLDFETNPKLLKEALDSLLDNVGLTEDDILALPQLSLTSVLGNDNWNESTGKIKDLRFPEKAYSEVNKSLKGSYIEELILAFPEYTRWRLLKLASRSNYSIHSDSKDGKQNIRLHIPVLSDPNAYLMFFDERTEPKMYHLEVGSAYEVNTTGLHSAINFGNADRYHIVGVKYTDQRFTNVKHGNDIRHY